LELEVTGCISYWRGPSPYHFVAVPDAESDRLRSVAREVTYGWGMIPVLARVGGMDWDTSLFPKEGHYLIPLKDAVRRAESLDVGDQVTIRLVITPHRY
jgi:Domain of unknown function (DUF1905)